MSDFDGAQQVRIAIFGVGAVGGCLGAHLTRMGHETVFIARGDHLSAILASGLTLESGGNSFTVRPTLATSDPADAGVVDVVFMCMKAWQLPQAAEAIRPMCGTETVVVTVQNGVEASDVVAAAVGTERVLIGIFETLSEVQRPGLISVRSRRSILRFGERDGVVSARVEKLKQLMSTKELAVETPRDIMTALWMKLLLIAPFSGAGSTTRSPIGVWRKVEESRRLAECLMAEIVAVASARGVALGPQALNGVLRTIDVLPPESKSSMQRDLEAGRRSELDAQIGSTVRLGHTAAVQTPAHEFVLAALMPQELRAQGLISF